MADYALIYFGKPLADLQYADVEHFFTSEHSESDQIEFKSFNPNGPLESKLAGIIEGITAFLNSSGGLLIWGAPEGSKVAGRKEKVFVGDLTKLPLTIEKDWLISKIADKIIPLPRGFRVQLITCADGQVAVFEIDESPYSPHQTDNRYYMRIDGQNKPAPHHYIEALFKKVTFPRLEAYINVGSVRFEQEKKRVLVEVHFLFFNLSHFLNEEKLSIHIELNGAYFLKGMTNDSVNLAGVTNYRYNGKEYLSNPLVANSIAYGYPYILTQELCFKDSELKRLRNRATISLLFSGKAAPSKFCRYHLKVSTDRSSVTSNANKQNILVSELNRETGLTESALLDEFKIVKSQGDEWYRDNW